MEIKHEIENEQHFLTNTKLLLEEVSTANLNKKDRVIEIGGGKGILTEKLAEKSGEVLCFEIDERFMVFLDPLSQKFKNLKIIYKNALDTSWKGYNKIVSNIPYSASEPIILKAIDSEIDQLVLIVGENFKNILVSNQTKISLIANLFFKITPVTFVGKDCFIPQPRVNSWLIKLKRKPEDSSEQIVRNIVRKKGNIKNAIIKSFVESGKTKNQAREFIKKLKLSENILNKPNARITSKLIIRIMKLLKTDSDYS